MRIKHLLPLLLGLGLLLAGCGYNGNGTTATGGPATGATATTVSPVTPGATTAATVLPSATHGAGSSGVTIHLSAPGYHTHEAIVVTISNSTSQTITFADHQSNCTIVLLQRQNAAKWDSLGLCKLMIATRILEMGAGKSQMVTLQPPSTGWQPGTYRVVFTYNMGTSITLSPAVTPALSPAFQVS